MQPLYLKLAALVAVFAVLTAAVALYRWNDQATDEWLAREAQQRYDATPMGREVLERREAFRRAHGGREAWQIPEEELDAAPVTRPVSP